MVGFFGSVLVLLFFQLAGVDPTAGAVQIVAFMMVDATIAVLLVILFVRAEGESLRSVGWRWGGFRREALLGLMALPVLFLATFLVGLFFQNLLPEYVSKSNPLLNLIKTHWDLLLFIVSSVYVGGFKEEVQRAFVLVRFEQYLGGVYVGLVLWSMVFALGHRIQGVDSAVGAGILGLLFGILYIWRRKLTSPMIAHMLYDIVTLLVFWTILRP